MTFNIDGMIKKINMMRDGNEKNRLYNTLLSYITHYNCVNNSNPFDLSLLEKQIVNIEQFDRRLIINRTLSCKELYQDIDIYNKLYKSILLNANHYSLLSYYYPPIDYEEIMTYVEAFFQYLDADLYKLYNHLLEKGLIIETMTINNGGCLDINGDNSSIVIKNTDNLLKGITLVHEMGHAYDYYLNRNQKVHNAMPLNIETTPLVLEKLFFRFLEFYHLLNPRTIEICEQKHHIDNLLFANCAYVYNSLVLHQELPIDIILSINFNMNVPEDMIKKYSMVNDAIIKHWKQYINLYANLYGMAYLTSNVILNKSGTVKEAFAIAKEYSMMTKSLNNRETLDLFAKDEYLNATNRFVNKSLTKKTPYGVK